MISRALFAAVIHLVVAGTILWAAWQEFRPVRARERLAVVAFALTWPLAFVLALGRRY